MNLACCRSALAGVQAPPHPKDSAVTRTFAAAMRRANRLTPARLNIATRSIQTAMTELMVSAAMAPLSAMTPVQTLAAPKKIKRRTPKPKIKLAKIPKRKAGQTLSNVVSALRQTRALMPQVTPNTPKPGIGTIPKGAQFLSRRHRSAAGTRGYRLYIPAAFASAAKPPAGLIVMLHGCNQTPEDFATGTHMNTLADTHGLVIAYPEQTRASNPVSCCVDCH